MPRALLMWSQLIMAHSHHCYISFIMGTIASLCSTPECLNDPAPAVAAAAVCSGEVLGCTAPVINDQADALIFVADGRFHLEAMMIANPTLPAYRYDPYPRELIAETYDQVGESGGNTLQWLMG